MTLRRAALVLAAVLAAAPLQGCWLAAIGAAGTAAVVMDDRRPALIQFEDQGVEVNVSEAVHKRYGDKAHVDVTAFNRVVLLTGEVPDADTKAGVESIALATPNVHSVTNELAISGNSSLAARSSDTLLTAKVQGRFIDAGLFNPVHVKVVSEAGVVYLMGIVTGAESADAVEIARTTAGVRKVVKIFQLCKVSDEICRPPDRDRGRRARTSG